MTFHEVPDGPRLICVHDLDGSAERYRAFAKQLEGEWTIVATQARGLTDGAPAHASIPSEAAALIEALTEADPEGPYCLFGFGFGAILAFEIATQLRTAGREVNFLAFAGSRPPELENPKALMKSLSQRVAGFFSKSPETPTGPLTPAAAHLRALRAYKTTPLDGPACVILGADLGRDVENAWLDCLPEGFIERVACGSDELLIEPSVRRLCAILLDLGNSAANDQQ